jgi:hypothetical protein
VGDEYVSGSDPLFAWCCGVLNAVSLVLPWWNLVPASVMMLLLLLLLLVLLL